MSNILTNWLVSFGSSEAAISSIASKATELSNTLNATAESATAAFAKSAAATAELAEKIKVATANRREENESLRASRAELTAVIAAQRELAAAQNKGSKEGKAALASNLAEQKRVRQEIAQITAAIDNETSAINRAKTATEAQASAQKALGAAAKAATQEATAAAKAATAAGNAGAEGGNKAGGAFSFLSNILGSATTLFAGFFAVGKLKQLASEIIDVTAEFEKYQAVLTTIFNGNEDKAKRQLASLQGFAAKTPFQLNEITEAYVQLQNRGIAPTEAQLMNLADLAAASGKGIGQAAEAVLAAQAGIFRNLKQFGVVASVDGDKVKVTFRGVTTELEKGSEALTKYLLSLGSINGIAGSTDRISATLGGRISNLKDSFTELFAVIGEGNKGPLNFFIERVSILNRKLREYLESDESKAIKGSAQGVTDYGVIVGGVFEAVAKNAKTAGEDVNAALSFSFAGQDANLDRLLAKQEKRAKAAADILSLIKEKPGIFDAAKAFILPGGALLNSGELTAAQDLNLEEQTRLKLLQGQKNELKERFSLINKGNAKDAETVGLILTLKEKITKLDIVREAKSTSRAALVEKGGLNDQKDALEKELAILEGKKDKAKTDSGEKLRSALAALQASELTLRKEYNKQLEDEQKGNLTRLAKLQLDHDIEAIAQLKKGIIEKELAVKRAGGRGVNADGRLNAPQQAEVNKLTTLAQQTYSDKLAAIARETNAKILELQQDSDEKQVASLTAKFDEEIRVARKAENTLLVDALEAAKKRQLIQLTQAQALRQIDERQKLATTALKLGQGVLEAVPTEATAGSEVDPATLTKTQRFFKTLADARVDIEKNLQKQLLEAQLAGDRERLAATVADGTAATAIRRAELALAIQDGEQAVAKARTNTDFKGFLMNLLGVKPEDRDEVANAFDEFANNALEQINAFAQAQVDATRAVADNAKAIVQEKRSELDTELELNKQGFASNVETKRQELAEAKRIRAEALKDQKQAQRAQIILDAVEQSSKLASASASILAGFANIPFVGPALGIAAVAAMIGFFVASKAKALQAVNAQTLESGGYIGGRRHSQGGNKFVSLDGRSTVEHEAGEFVTKRRAASRWGHLLESINAEDESRMTQILFNDLLKGTGVVPPAANLPQRLQQAQASHQAASVYAGAASSQELASLRADVAAIRANTQPQAQTIDTGTAIITTEGNRTRIEHK